MKNKKIFLSIIIILALIVVIFSIVFLYIKNDKKNKQMQKENNEKLLLNKIKGSYNHIVKINSDAKLYDTKKNEIGIIYKDSELLLDDNYNITDNFYKLDGLDYYIKYDKVSKIDSLSIEPHSEYDTYKNYIPLNKNIVTNGKYKLYIKDKLCFEFDKSSEFSVIIETDDKYGVEFNNKLYYIEKTDVKEEKESNNSNKAIANDLPVLNYHYTVNREAKELEDCVQDICMEDTQVEEEIKYLSDNNYYALSMRDVYLYVKGYIQIPKNSVVITIDDGWYVYRMIPILEKYKLNGTLFLIGSLASPDAYRSEFLEIHSHSWDMHKLRVCNGGTHGGAILCWPDDKIQEDLKKSRESLNNTTVYCFPFYEYDNHAIEMLKQAGFEMSFIGGNRSVKVGDDLFKINRYVLVNSTDINTFISFVS